MIECTCLFRKKIHKTECAFLGNVQRDEFSVRLQRLFANVECKGQIFHVAGASVQIDHIIGILFQFSIFNRAERDYINAALLCDGAHVARRFDALDAVGVDHALEQTAAAADRKHTLAGNIAERLLKQAKFTLEQVIICHKPGIILCRIAIKFGFHLSEAPFR